MMTLELSEKEKAYLSLVFESTNEPLHLEGLASNLDCLKWKENDWIEFLGTDTQSVRFGKKLPHNRKKPQWERDCSSEKLTIQDIFTFHNTGKLDLGSCKYLASEHWAYMDYLYLKNILKSKSPNSEISWECFGMPEVKLENMTLWVGTAGANTPCHQDTYGYNVVVQVSGSKTWTLIDKEYSSNLYPTRVPYEESSIYSEVPFPIVDSVQFPKTSGVICGKVTLKPGDVLVVPKHTWHYVENNEFSISLNSWIPLPTDIDDQITEAIAQYQIGSLCAGIDLDTDHFQKLVNPNMFDVIEVCPEKLLQNLYNQYSYLCAKKKGQKNLSGDNISHHIPIFNSLQEKIRQRSREIPKENIQGYHQKNEVDQAEMEDKMGDFTLLLAKSLLSPSVLEGIKRNMKLSN